MLMRFVLLPMSALGVIILAACGQSSIESKVVGSWHHTTVDSFVQVTFHPDHALSIGFNDDPPRKIGTWRIEGRELVEDIEMPDTGEAPRRMTNREVIRELKEDQMVTSNGTSIRTRGVSSTHITRRCREPV